MPAVSSLLNMPTVAPRLWSPAWVMTEASMPSTSNSSPTQLLIADGVNVRDGVQPVPSCSIDMGGNIWPARTVK